MILTALVAVFVLFLWMPLRSAEKKLQHRLDVKTLEMLAERAAMPDIVELAPRVYKLQATVDDAAKHLPNDVQLAGLLSELNAMIKSLEVTESEIVQGEILRGVDYQVIPVTIRFRGSFPSAFQFIRQIEAMPCLIRFDNLKMASGTDKHRQSLEVTIQLDTFFAPREGRNP